jgi:nucleosome binding factor SPN SPT16 subunit
MKAGTTEPASTKFSAEVYKKNLKILYDDWQSKDNQDTWKGADALVFTNGTTDEEIIYKKTTAFQTWLFGNEMEDTITVTTLNQVIILTRANTASELGPIVSQTTTPVSTQILSINAGDNTDNFNQLIDAIRSSGQGKSVGTLTKETALGDFASAWKTKLDEAEFTYINILNAISNILSIKDERELKCIQSAAAISAAIMKNFLVPEIETIIDEEKEVTHSSIAEKNGRYLC